MIDQIHTVEQTVPNFGTNLARTVYIIIYNSHFYYNSALTDTKMAKTKGDEKLVDESRTKYKSKWNIIPSHILAPLI